MIIEKEIDLFSYSVAYEGLDEAVPFIVVSREEKKVNYCLFVVKEVDARTIQDRLPSNPDRLLLE